MKKISLRCNAPMCRFFRHVLIFSYAIVVLACSHSKEITGKARFTGRFSGYFPVEKNFMVKVSVPNLVLGELKQLDEYEIQLELDGSFSLSIPLFCPVYALFSVNEEGCGVFFLSPDQETKVELSLNEMGKMQIKIIEGQELTMEDMDNINKSFMEFIYKVYDPNSFNELRLDMSPEEYKECILQWTEKQISTIVEENENLPENLKQLLDRELKWNTYTGYLFSYESTLQYLYEKQQNEKGMNNTVFPPARPDKPYYSFLGFFDWSNSPVFNTPAYPRIFKYILADSVLNIPDINNRLLTDWIKEVKTIMADLIGSDAGWFYDMLILHAYWKQLDEELQPLSGQQIEDIKFYFKNPTFAKFLFMENEATIQQVKLSAIIKETPAVDKEKLIEAIVSSYKGKVVVVDFWATWCGPCLIAIKESQELKLEMQDRDLVFVFITNDSSPKNIWEKKIPGIGGEHYYLQSEEWKSISFSTKYGFQGIPAYLIFNKKGELKNKMTAYPGNDEMRAMIEELL